MQNQQDLMRDEDWNWRRVPKVSLITPEKKGRKTLIIFLLVIALIVEVVAGGYLYLERTTTQDSIATQRLALTTAQNQLTALQSDIRDAGERVGQLEQQLAGSQPTELILDAPIDWGPSLSALAQLENSEVRFTVVQTNPSGAIELQGTSGSVAAIGQLQSDLQINADLFEVVSLQWQGEETGVTFQGTLRVKRNDATR